ncbi:MAG: hypothetical protein FD180_3876 [Planctomycetota bacterium]|nr:MAG: hypothetical protein FD180_3876 [Planctomycetota bacterium]
MPPAHAPAVDVLERCACDGYEQLRIQYAGDEDDMIAAFLLIPPAQGPRPAVLIHHQHNGERHWGKSEVCGLAGNPLQAFGPALARRGFVVLAPDSIAFEDRRAGRQGTQPAPDPEEDWLQHFNQMAYRLLRGDTLMRKVLSDALRGTAVLAGDPRVDARRVGLLGHSYGGNTVLFQAAVDDRVAFACSSGAAASFRQKFAAGTGIEMAEVIPGFAQRWDIDDLIGAASPRRMLIVSAAEDKYSQDAADIVHRARTACVADGVPDHLEHQPYPGGHALTSDRFEGIVRWMDRMSRER